eukprot:COSAG01_NODE_13775_length_1537_cov_2.120306_3_plen_50_part_01
MHVSLPCAGRTDSVLITDAPVDFTCRNRVTEVSVSCQNELAPIMPNRAYY